MELDQRKLRILQAIIDDYILTAAPVGSRTISKRADFNISSATIRNEMSDLEEMGYLEQPHTSAGRVPSNKAYRLYVNRIMQRAQLNDEERKIIRSYFFQRIDQVEGLVRQTATALSDITKYTAMVLPPQLNTVRIRHVQIVQINHERALLVLVTDTGMLRDVMLRLPEGMSGRDVERFSNRLNFILKDMRLDQLAIDEVQLLSEEMNEQRQFFQTVLDSLEQQMRSNAQKVELSGATNILFYPEYNNMEKAKSFLAALNTEGTLYQMLKRASKLEFSISIGDENEAPELSDCSIVTATYRMGSEPMGSFGVIGPTRMHYNRMLSILEYMRLSLSEALAGLIERDGDNKV
ncbi:MAG: heat-inducible transcriptional repressor HrcA [Clostridiales bacterium]|jgi:heat-inducible transcriptional repressor|nr:heat-inducible transcriptional repressor HrcA [Clostridiales bacterium]